jgi:hypothetical protein
VERNQHLRAALVAHNVRVLERAGMRDADLADLVNVEWVMAQEDVETVARVMEQS